MKVRPAIRRIAGQQVKFVDGRSEQFDAIVLATGYKSNVPCWLKVYGNTADVPFAVEEFQYFFS